ncbi:YqaE/Pmp3 family membrane protein [Desulfuromonas thiophila]|uniref:YqaE/Pmp3 family membrane protein n=1 Tax=Desulfuromonas thiophila TaxID=57664 RepID=UPI003CCC0112
MTPKRGDADDRHHQGCDSDSARHRAAAPWRVFAGRCLHFWLNLLLTLLGYVPGIIHAVWVMILKK